MCAYLTFLMIYVASLTGVSCHQVVVSDLPNIINGFSGTSSHVGVGILRTLKSLKRIVYYNFFFSNLKLLLSLSLLICLIHTNPWVVAHLKFLYGLFQAGQAKGSHAQAYRREALPVYSVWRRLCPQLRPEESHACAYRLAPLPVLQLF